MYFSDGDKCRKEMFNDCSDDSETARGNSLLESLTGKKSQNVVNIIGNEVIQIGNNNRNVVEHKRRSKKKTKHAKE